jgi:hypothetical protein
MQKEFCTPDTRQRRTTIKICFFSMVQGVDFLGIRHALLPIAGEKTTAYNRAGKQGPDSEQSKTMQKEKL